MKKYSKKISRIGWQFNVWSPIIIGAIIFSIFNSAFFIPEEYLRASMYGAIGGILIGWGFGLAFSRVWKIQGVDK